MLTSILDLIKQTFANVKWRLHEAGSRNVDALWRTLGNISDLFGPQECWNSLKTAGYASEERSDAPAPKWLQL